jgi:ABC-type nitrate/sulfonate/bicarbonate transport system substrate-binding protein
MVRTAWNQYSQNNRRYIFGRPESFVSLQLERRPRMRVNLLCLGAIGLSSIVLAVTQRNGLFKKHGLEVQLIAVRGTAVPEFTTTNPIGHIGAPAAVMRAGTGADLRLIASFDTSRLSNCLVVRPGINTRDQLRGKRLGARVAGAAMWIHTVIALEALGLDRIQDRISIAEIGDPSEIIRALEAGAIDGAVLARAQCEQLTRQGCSILLDLSPLDVYGAPDALVVTAHFLNQNPDVAAAVLAGLIEGAAFALSPNKRPAVLEAIKSEMRITDNAIAECALHDLSRVLARKPYPSVERLRNMQRIMLTANARVLGVTIEGMVDDRFVRRLDESGAIDRTYVSYGVPDPI